MTITQEVTVLNAVGNASLDRRDRTTSTGTTARYSISFEAQPILHDWQTLMKAPKVAEAIRLVLQTKLRALSATVAPQTELRRDRYARELAAGGGAARARYTGGRTGVTPPKASSRSRLFNDSGRFANGLAVMRNSEEDGFTINVPANRLDPRTFGGGEAAIVALWQRLTALVPEFKGGTAVLRYPEVQQAIAADQVDAVFVADSRSGAALRQARSRLAGRIVRDLMRVVQLGA